MSKAYIDYLAIEVTKKIIVRLLINTIIKIKDRKMKDSFVESLLQILYENIGEEKTIQYLVNLVNFTNKNKIRKDLRRKLLTTLTKVIEKKG